MLSSFPSTTASQLSGTMDTEKGADDTSVGFVHITAKAQHFYFKKKGKKKKTMKNPNRASAQLQGGLGNCAMLGTLR